MDEKTMKDLAKLFQPIATLSAQTNNVSKNLDYDLAVKYFFDNMERKGLSIGTKHFYKNKLNSFRKFVVSIKKISAINTLTSEELITTLKVNTQNMQIIRIIPM